MDVDRPRADPARRAHGAARLRGRAADRRAPSRAAGRPTTRRLPRAAGQPLLDDAAVRADYDPADRRPGRRRRPSTASGPPARSPCPRTAGCASSTCTRCAAPPPGLGARVVRNRPGGARGRRLGPGRRAARRRSPCSTRARLAAEIGRRMTAARGHAVRRRHAPAHRAPAGAAGQGARACAGGSTPRGSRPAGSSTHLRLTRDGTALARDWRGGPPGAGRLGAEHVETTVGATGDDAEQAAAVPSPPRHPVAGAHGPPTPRCRPHPPTLPAARPPAPAPPRAPAPGPPPATGRWPNASPSGRRRRRATSPADVRAALGPLARRRARALLDRIPALDGLLAAGRFRRRCARACVRRSARRRPRAARRRLAAAWRRGDRPQPRPARRGRSDVRRACLVGADHGLGARALWRGYPVDPRGDVLSPLLGLPRDAHVDIGELAGWTRRSRSPRTWPRHRRRDRGDHGVRRAGRRRAPLPERALLPPGGESTGPGRPRARRSQGRRRAGVRRRPRPGYRVLRLRPGRRARSEARRRPGCCWRSRSRPARPPSASTSPGRGDFRHPADELGRRSWGHLVTGQEELDALTHARADEQSAGSPTSPLDGATWGRSSAHSRAPLAAAVPHVHPRRPADLAMTARAPGATSSPRASRPPIPVRVRGTRRRAAAGAAARAPRDALLPRASSRPSCASDLSRRDPRRRSPPVRAASGLGAASGRCWRAGLILPAPRRRLQGATAPAHRARRRATPHSPGSPGSSGPWRAAWVARSAPAQRAAARRAPGARRAPLRPPPRFPTAPSAPPGAPTWARLLPEPLRRRCCIAANEAIGHVVGRAGRRGPGPLAPALLEGAGVSDGRDLLDAQGLDWTHDFDAAVAAGMAIRMISPSSTALPAHGFDALLVLGVRAGDQQPGAGGPARRAPLHARPRLRAAGHADQRAPRRAGPGLSLDRPDLAAVRAAELDQAAGPARAGSDPRGGERRRALPAAAADAAAFALGLGRGTALDRGRNAGLTDLRERGR